MVRFLDTVLCALAVAIALPAASQDYPNRPIRLIVGFAPGGSTDIVGRIVAQRLTGKLGQPVVVENKPGAGGTIGADLVAKAPPDGYTLTLGTTSTHAISAGAYSKLPYNPVNDFTEPLASATPAAFTEVLKVQVGKYVALTKTLGIKLD